MNVIIVLQQKQIYFWLHLKYSIVSWFVHLLLLLFYVKKYLTHTVIFYQKLIKYGH